MKFHPVPLLLLVAATALAQVREKGPYTLHPIIPGVVRIEDANHVNPAGIQLDAQGKIQGGVDFASRRKPAGRSPNL